MKWLRIRAGGTPSSPPDMGTLVDGPDESDAVNDSSGGVQAPSALGAGGRGTWPPLPRVEMRSAVVEWRGLTASGAHYRVIFEHGAQANEILAVARSLHLHAITLMEQSSSKPPNAEPITASGK